MNNTALIIVDMVKDFTDPGWLITRRTEILPKIVAVLEESRNFGKLIIFCNIASKGKPDKNLRTMRPNCIEGTDWRSD